MGQYEELGGFHVLEDTLSILFIDDEPILREFAQVHLTTDASTVHVAETGARGMSLADELRPDIVLLDLDMPGLDGFEILTRLRGDPAHARTPIVVLVRGEDTAAIDRAFEGGASGFAVKPINWRLLSYQIRYLNRAYQAERALAEGRRRARSDAAEAADALDRLADAGSRFLAQALRATPGLKTEVEDYLQALEAASGRRRV